MRTKQYWFIISLKTRQPVIVQGDNSLVLSSEEIAFEVGKQMFDKDDFIVCQIPDFKKQ